jgi:hypothetical protein
MNSQSGKVMLLPGRIILFTITLGCRSMKLAGKSERGEEEKKADGKIVCLDQDLDLRVSFSNFWRAAKNIINPVPQEK